MADSFATMWRALRNYVPQLPPGLAQQFIQQRYRQILERGPWSALRAEVQFRTTAAVTAGTVEMTLGSADVVGTGTSFAATDVGRQFQVGNSSPVYTVATVTDATNLTLSRTYLGTSVGADLTYRILDAYVTMPDDFMRWVTLVDPQRGYKLRTWITQAELSQADPQRTSAGDPFVVADRAYTSAGLIQYEWWPYPTTARVYVGYYIKRGVDLVQPSDTPIWPLRGDEIVKGALLDVCKWPGTQEQPNPMFGQPVLMKAFAAEFEDLLIELERQDQDIALTWLSETGMADWPMAPFDAKFLQTHAY